MRLLMRLNATFFLGNKIENLTSPGFDARVSAEEVILFVQTFVLPFLNSDPTAKLYIDFPVKRKDMVDEFVVYKHLTVPKTPTSAKLFIRLFIAVPITPHLQQIMSIRLKGDTSDPSEIYKVWSWIITIIPEAETRQIELLSQDGNIYYIKGEKNHEDTD